MTKHRYSHIMRKIALDMTVVENRRLTSAYSLLILEADKPVEDFNFGDITPGQFVQVRVDDSKTTFLRRPISVNFVEPDRCRLHLLVRRAESTGELLAALVTSSQYDDAAMEQHLQNLADMLLKLPLEGTIAGFLHIVNDSLGDVVKSDETHIIYGKDWFMENVLGLQFRITPFSFFQTNTKGAEVLYQRARDYVLSGAAGESSGDGVRSRETEESDGAGVRSGEPAEMSGDSVPKSGLSGKTVFDLYSGTGTIAQILAPVAGHVIGVEIVEEAVEAAKENAALNGLTNCDFIAGDVLKVIDEIEEKPDYIVLDPPRDGVHPKALQKIIDYGVQEIVYISCKPTSLARDLVALQESGYRVKRVSCVDMFCSTVHCETVCLMEREGK